MIKQEPGGGPTAALKSALINEGRSLTWLSETTGIAYKTLRRRMADPTQLTVRELGQIAAALHTEPHDFFADALSAAVA